MKRFIPAILIAGMGIVLLLTTLQQDVAPPVPPVDPMPCPGPGPCPAPKPKPQPKPWGPNRTAGRPSFGAKVSGPKFDDGTELQVDFPGDHHRRNTSSKGLGLCVFTSIHHAADWQDIPALLEMPKWMIAKGIPGGGYPEKVRDLIPKLAAERGLPVPEFVQVEKYDYDILKMACGSGRMACVTYSKSPTGRYGGSRISHMVNVVHADDKHVVVLDNNYIGEDAYEWMTPAEFKAAGGLEWAVVFTDVPPPPSPHNGGVKQVECVCPCGIPDCRCAECHCGEQEKPDYEWEQWNKGDDRYWTLWVDSEPGRMRVHGYWDSADRKYYRYLGDKRYSGQPSEPPRPVPGSDWRTQGVEAWRSERPRYFHGAYEVTREDVVAALAAVPQDGKRLRVTVIGAKEDRARVEQDWKVNPKIAAVKDAFLFKAYAPDHWHVAKVGFKTDGKPTIYVQDATGKVLARLDAYAGPDDLAGKLRRLRPDYDPNKDNGGTSPGGSAANPLTTLLLVGGVGAALIALRRRNA